MKRQRRKAGWVNSTRQLRWGLRGARSFRQLTRHVNERGGGDEEDGEVDRETVSASGGAIEIMSGREARREEKEEEEEEEGHAERDRDMAGWDEWIEDDERGTVLPPAGLS